MDRRARRIRRAILRCSERRLPERTCDSWRPEDRRRRQVGTRGILTEGELPSRRRGSRQLGAARGGSHRRRAPAGVRRCSTRRRLRGVARARRAGGGAAAQIVAAGMVLKRAGRATAGSGHGGRATRRREDARGLSVGVRAWEVALRGRAPSCASRERRRRRSGQRR